METAICRLFGTRNNMLNLGLETNYCWLICKCSTMSYSWIQVPCINNIIKWLILLQIEDGDIYASINQRDGMVSFHHNSEKYNNPKMLKKLDSEVCQPACTQDGFLSEYFAVVDINQFNTSSDIISVYNITAHVWRSIDIVTSNILSRTVMFYVEFCFFNHDSAQTQYNINCNWTTSQKHNAWQEMVQHHSCSAPLLVLLKLAGFLTISIYYQRFHCYATIYVN